MKGHTRRAASIVAIAAALAGTQAIAANRVWTGASTDWFDPANWGGATPTSADTARITAQAESPRLDGGNAEAMTVNIGSTSTATITLLNGATLTSDSAILGFGATDSAFVVVSGTNTLWDSDFFNIGLNGTGLFRVDAGGRVQAGTVSIAGTSTAIGSATFDTGSTLSATSVFVGDAGRGTLTVSGASVLQTMNGSIATNAGSLGTLSITGTGSRWSMTGNLSIGSRGTASATVDQAGALTAGGFRLGEWGGAAGTLIVTGTNSIATATGTSNALLIGDRGAGHVTISNGGQVLVTGGTGSVRIASQTGSAGTLSIGAAAGDAAAAAGQLSANAVVFGLGTGQIIFNHTDADYQFGALVSGSGTVRQQAGTTRLTRSNSYSGGTTILGGTLEAAIAGSLGTGAVAIGGGSSAAALRFGADMTLANAIQLVNAQASIDTEARNVTLSGIVSGPAALVKNGTGTLRLGGANVHAGGTMLNAGTLVGRTDSFGAGAIDTANGSTLVLDIASSATLGNQILGAGTLVKQGAGDLSIVAGNLFSGDTRIEAGSVRAGVDEALGTGNVDILAGASASFVGSSASGARTITNAGTLGFAGSASGALTQVVNNTGGLVDIAGLTNGGASIGSLSGAGDIALGANRLTLGALNGSDTISGTISGTGSLEKAGSGTLTLAGANDFTGATTVTAGALRVDGTVAGDVDVSGGAALAGSGAIAGDVTIADGGRIVGQTGQTLGLGSLSLSLGAIVDVTIGAPSQTALFDVDGALVLDGTLNIHDVLGFAPGVTRLFDYGGALTDNGLEIGGVPAGNAATDFLVQTAMAGQINLISKGGLTFNFWDGSAAGNAGNHRVDGGSGTWSRTGAAWTDSNGTLTLAMDPQPGLAIFGGTAGTVTVDNGAGAVAAAGMQFLTDGYVVTGDAITLGSVGSIVRVGDGTAAGAQITATIDSGLTGAGGIHKTDLGTLVLGASNSYQGGTVISGGTLIGKGDSFGSGTIRNDATLIIDQRVEGSFANTLLGNGIVNKTGAGTLLMSGDGSGFTGTTTLTQGTILLSGALGGGVDIAAGATLKIGVSDASGALTADVRNNGTLIFARSDDFDYGGALSGTGSLIKRGDGLLLLSGDYSYTGSTIVEGGRVQLGATLAAQTDLIVDGGTFDLGNQMQQVASLSGTSGTIILAAGAGLTVSQTTNTAFSGALSGAGAFTKSGTGTLNLTGTSSFIGQALVNQGRLLVNGLLPGSIVVTGGGILGGTGTIGGLAVQSGGILAPGNSIGALNVTGNIIFATGTVYEVEVNPLIGADGFGQADRLVAGGSAVLQGGTVNILAADGAYAPATTYKIMTAAGGVTGTFAGSTDNLAYLDSRLTYDANNVYVEMLRNDVDFAATVDTANQRATAGAVEALGGDNPVYRAAIRLTADEAVDAFDQLSGEIHASARTALFEDSRIVRDAVLGQLSAPSAQRRRAWLQAIGNWGSSDGNTNAARVDRNTTGFLIGVDTAIGDHCTLGIGGGRTETDLASQAGNGGVESTQLFAYAGAAYGPVRIRAGFGYAIADLHIRRSIDFTTLNDGLTAQYDGSLYQGFAELGYAMPVGPGNVEPFAGITTMRVRTDAFDEDGGAARLSIGKASDSTTASTLGLKLALPDNGGFSLRAMGGWQHAFGTLASTSIARFGTGTAFAITGAPLSRDAAIAEVEAALQLSRGVSVGASYKGALGSASHDHMVAGRLTIGF